MNRLVKYAILSASALIALAAVSTHASAADTRSVDSSFGKMEIVESGETVNWSGLYIGGSVGYGNANHNLTVQQYSNDLVCTSQEGCGEGIANGDVIVEGTSLDLLNLDGVNSSGVIGDVRIGYDVALGRVVAGLFGAYSITNMESELTVLPGFGPTISLEKQDEWQVGARLGVIVAPRTMAYVLAAYSQTEYEVNGIQVGPLPEGARFSKGATFDGVSVGGGIEFALAANVFFGVEYQHTFYGEETLLDFNDGENGSSNNFRIIDDLDEDKVLATLKIKFGGIAR